MNNMGMERGRMRKEPDNQSSGKAMAKIVRKTAAAASRATKTPQPYDSDSDTAYHIFSYFVQNLLEARLDNALPCSCSLYVKPPPCHPKISVLNKIHKSGHERHWNESKELWQKGYLIPVWQTHDVSDYFANPIIYRFLRSSCCIFLNIFSFSSVNQDRIICGLFEQIISNNRQITTALFAIFVDYLLVI